MGGDGGPNTVTEIKGRRTGAAAYGIPTNLVKETTRRWTRGTRARESDNATGATEDLQMKSEDEPI